MNNKQLLSEFSIGDKVWLFDDKYLSIIGVGTIKLHDVYTKDDEGALIIAKIKYASLRDKACEIAGELFFYENAGILFLTEEESIIYDVILS